MHFHLYLGVSRQVLSVSLQYMNSTPINELVSLASIISIITLCWFDIAIEHGHFSVIYPLNMVIFVHINQRVSKQPPNKLHYYHFWKYHVLLSLVSFRVVSFIIHEIPPKHPSKKLHHHELLSITIITAIRVSLSEISSDGTPSCQEDAATYRAAYEEAREAGWGAKALDARLMLLYMYTI